MILAIVFYFVFKRELKPFKQIADMATTIFDDFDEDTSTKITSFIDTLEPIAKAAVGINEILSNEESFKAGMQTLAHYIRTSFVAGLLGEVSGDSKRMAKADKLIDKAMVKGLAGINPMLQPLIEGLNLEGVIDEDPKMFNALVGAVFKEGGILSMIAKRNPNLFGGLLGGLEDSSSMAVPPDSGEEY